MRKYIPVEESIREWEKDPEYQAAYDALEDQYDLASALIGARAEADMTQEQVAEAMGTSLATIVRIEGGKSVSLRLLRRYAEATGHRLRIRFEADEKIKQAITHRNTNAAETVRLNERSV